MKINTRKQQVTKLELTFSGETQSYTGDLQFEATVVYNTTGCTNTIRVISHLTMDLLWCFRDGRHVKTAPITIVTARHILL